MNYRTRAANHAFDGGLSKDGQRIGEAYHSLHLAKTIDLGGGDGDEITPRLDEGNQCCNASMSPDNDYYIMHLRINHDGCNLRTWDDALIRTIWKPADATEMQDPEFSTNPGFSTFTAQYESSYYMFIANTQTGEHLKIAEGNFANPHLWVAPATSVVQKIALTPPTNSILPSEKTTFKANATDQHEEPIAAVISWSVSGGGAMAPKSSGAPVTEHSSEFTSDGSEWIYTVIAAADAVQATATVEVAREPQYYPTIEIALVFPGQQGNQHLCGDQDWSHDKKCDHWDFESKVYE